MRTYVEFVSALREVNVFSNFYEVIHVVRLAVDIVYQTVWLYNVQRSL